MDIIPRFIELLGIKTVQDVLENGGNACSIIALNNSIQDYGLLLFDIKYSKPDIFAGEQRHPIDIETFHDLAIKSIDVKFDEFGSFLEQHLGKDYDLGFFRKARNHLKVEDALFSIHYASLQTTAAFKASNIDADEHNKELHPRIGGRKDNPRIADIPTDTSPGKS